MCTIEKGHEFDNNFPEEGTQSPTAEQESIEEKYESPHIHMSEDWPDDQTPEVKGARESSQERLNLIKSSRKGKRTWQDVF